MRRWPAISQASQRRDDEVLLCLGEDFPCGRGR